MSLLIECVISFLFLFDNYLKNLRSFADANFILSKNASTVHGIEVYKVASF